MVDRIVPAAGGLVLAAILSACAGKAEYQPSEQSGAHPPLPAPENYLMPPMQVPRGVGWALSLIHI